MPHTLLAQISQFVVHGIPLFLLTFGILYLALGFVTGNGGLSTPIAVLAIAASLAWLVISGQSFGGFLSLTPDVMTVLGVGVVAVVLAKIFGAAGN